MKLVVDANVLFAALTTDGKTRELLFDERLQPSAPSFALDELRKYRELLARKMHCSLEDVEEAIDALARHVHIIPEILTRPFLGHARQFSPDPLDAAYFAAALFLGTPLWTNDKLLQNQTRVQIWTTQTVIDFIEHDPDVQTHSHP